eukprot:4390538-Amphidinium_carterae.2
MQQDAIFKSVRCRAMVKAFKGSSNHGFSSALAFEGQEFWRPRPFCQSERMKQSLEQASILPKLGPAQQHQQLDR